MLIKIIIIIKKSIRICKINNNNSNDNNKNTKKK